tara:strand:+ start:332 stop:676 length:345 start_codon:yes stop_codon:yes gene_type:complete
MKKDIKTYMILGIIVIAIIILIFSLKGNGNTPEQELAQCIGENSELYSQLGCRYCEIQEDMFGSAYSYLNVIDCAYEPEKCQEAEIRGTPTWVINNEKYPGVREISELKQLTGC